MATNGSLIVQLKYLKSADLCALDKVVDGPAVFGFEWWGQRRAIRGDSPAGFPLLWEKTVKFKVTKDMAQSISSPVPTSPVEVTLYGQSGRVAIAGGRFAADPTLWQDSPTQVTGALASPDGLHKLEAVLTCCYSAPEGYQRPSSTMPVSSSPASSLQRTNMQHVGAHPTKSTSTPPLPRHSRASSISQLPPLSLHPSQSSHRSTSSGSSAQGLEVIAPPSAFAALAESRKADPPDKQLADADRADSLDDPNMNGSFGQAMRECKSQYLRLTVSDFRDVRHPDA